MSAPKGNRFWEARTKHGRDKLFTSEAILWEASVEYFKWVEDNPLKEQKATQFQGTFIKGAVNKMRAMTIEGLCLFLDISRPTWYEYKEHEDFTYIIGKIEDVIRSQKFAGAAADLLNASIIARDLGLKDESKRELTGGYRLVLSQDDLDL